MDRKDRKGHDIGTVIQCLLAHRFNARRKKTITGPKQETTTKTKTTHSEINSESKQEITKTTTKINSESSNLRPDILVDEASICVCSDSEEECTISL